VGESVDKQYEQYCLTDPLFYDSPRHDDSEALFPISRRPLPSDWRRARHGDWLINIPPGPPIPAQGWKIHVSACLDNADDIITRVWQYCMPRGISFKFIGSPLAVLMRNAKYAPRQASGKAVTIYPADEATCEVVLRELDAELVGAPGPYILSDLRYGAGPLYVRYGGFTERFCLDAQGEMMPAIEDPAGNLVPDLRSPVFTVPDWVVLPEFLAPQLAARNSVSVAELDYDVTGALHFSNGGGVYTGTDKRTGERVIMKEARPHAGLAADGSDAVTRLRREHDVLKRLSGLGIAPEPRGCFMIGEHHFLAEEFIAGRTLNSFFAERYPLTGLTTDPAATEAYTEWALRICADVERAARVMHDHGVVFNDLHMFNIMVQADDTVAFIDFEAASDISEGPRRTVGNPGFAAPRDRVGFDIDAYSLACIRLAMFMPLTTLFALDRGKAEGLAAIIAKHFPVPEKFLDEAVREIVRDSGTADHRAPENSTPDNRTPLAVTLPVRRRGTESVAAGGNRADLSWGCDAGWDRLAADMVTAIRASASPQRTDRLFPGDIDQVRVTGGGLALAHGAAGVLYALSEAAGVRVPDYEEWLIARAADPAKGTRPGLYDGLSGVAYTLARLGHVDAAAQTAGICLGERWERLGHGLYGGLSGFALAMLAVGDTTGERELTRAGMRAAEIVADRYAAAPAQADVPAQANAPAAAGERAAGSAEPRRAAGLLHGASGKALLFIRLYERTGDAAWLDAAAVAIAEDLDRCVTDRKSALQVDDGWRTLPYVGGGSVGIGMVIDQFLAHRPHEGFAAAAAKIRLAATSGFYAQAGLFNGRAGMIAYLAGTAAAASTAREQVDRLGWHTVRYAGGVAFPGDMLFRLSMDLGTGTAGVLLGTAAALASHGAALPFLAQPTDLRDSVPGSAQACQGAPENRTFARR
jgi:tRNA A-37 threonylcarbamoyl transferase component Bud32